MISLGLDLVVIENFSETYPHWNLDIGLPVWFQNEILKFELLPLFLPSIAVLPPLFYPDFHPIIPSTLYASMWHILPLTKVSKFNYFLVIVCYITCLWLFEYLLFGYTCFLLCQQNFFWVFQISEHYLLTFLETVL